MKIPTLTISPTHSLFLDSISDASLTLVQKRATIITDSMEHDLTITTAGKEAAWIALLYVSMFTLTTTLHIPAFLAGI